MHLSYSKPIIYSIVLPPKILLWHLLEHWWICIYRWCVYLWVSIYLFSGAETLRVFSAPMSLSGATEAQRRYILSNFPNNTLCCISYCQINQTWSIFLSQPVIGGISYTRIQLATCLSLRELKEVYAGKAVIASFLFQMTTFKKFCYILKPCCDLPGCPPYLWKLVLFLNQWCSAKINIKYMYVHNSW